MPGAIGAFRREAPAAVGGLSSQTPAEHTDLTMALPAVHHHAPGVRTTSGMTANRSAMSTTRMDTQITLFGAALVASRHTAAGAHIGGSRMVWRLR